MKLTGLARVPFGLRASLSASMVGLALLVSLVGLIVHTALTMRAAMTASSERAKSVAQQAALLAGRATGEPGASPADVMVRRDRALAALFESSLAGDPTLFDIGVFDGQGYALAHSEPERRPSNSPAPATSSTPSSWPWARRVLLNWCGPARRGLLAGS